MSENNTANQEVEQVEQPVETSREEKFFGVKHQIGKDICRAPAGALQISSKRRSCSLCYKCSK